MSIGNLSKREIDVLKCLATCKTYKQIASELCISVDTVRSHIKVIYRTLNVHTNVEAVVKYMKIKQAK